MTSPPDTGGGRPRLVGRADEKRLLWRDLDRLAAGHGAVIELVGDPGIGKTRLLTELAQEACRRGIDVLRGNATEFERDLPFGVFVSALADRYRRPGPGTLADAAKVPLAALLHGEGAQGSGADRFRVYAAVRDLLTEWAGSGLVLILDDMHWADPGAIELAEYLVRRPPDAALLLVLALRGRQAAARLAGTLASGMELGTVSRVELGPLSPAESAELASPGLDDLTLQRICAESGGNPLYLLAAAAASRAGHPAAAAAPSRAPNPLEAVLLAELAPLTTAEATVAAAGAVIGEQFSIDALRPVAGLSARDVAAAVGALTRRDILRPAAAQPAMLTFRHPVLRQVIYQGAEPAWRAAAHRRALAELSHRGAPAAELAHHVAASPGARLPDDLEILRTAATAAMSSAPGTAAHWLRVALEMLPDDAAHADQRLEILLMLTRALGVAGRLAESRELMHEILRLVPLDPPGPRVAAVAFCARMERLLARYPEARALLETELSSPRAAETGEGVTLAIEYGALAVLSASFPSARDTLLRAVRSARHRGNQLREAHALACGALGEVYEGNVPVAARAADTAAALVDQMTDRELSAEPESLAVLGWAELFLERCPDASRHLGRGVAISRHSGHFDVLPHLLLGQGLLACWCGPLDRAITLSEEAEEIARHIDCRDVLGFALGLRSLAFVWAGGPDSAKRAIDLAEQAVAIVPPESAWWARTVATVRAAALLLGGDPQGCLRAMAATAGSGLSLIQPSLRPIYLDMMTGASIMTGDQVTAREWSQRAGAEAQQLGLAGQRGYALRSRGYLLAASGRNDRAAACLEEAADLLGSAGMRVGQAWALALAASAAATAGHPDTAVTLATEARSLAQAVASITILDAADATLQLLATRPADPDAADPLAGLTDREREVARLAATGLSSRDIATELSVSPRTVDTHLSRIYRKLDLGSRAALASHIAGQQASGPSSGK